MASNSRYHNRSPHQSQSHYHGQHHHHSYYNNKSNNYRSYSNYHPRNTHHDTGSSRSNSRSSTTSVSTPSSLTSRSRTRSRSRQRDNRNHKNSDIKKHPVQYSKIRSPKCTSIRRSRSKSKIEKYRRSPRSSPFSCTLGYELKKRFKPKPITPTPNNLVNQNVTVNEIYDNNSKINSTSNQQNNVPTVSGIKDSNLIKINLSNNNEIKNNDHPSNNNIKSVKTCIIKTLPQLPLPDVEMESDINSSPVMRYAIKLQLKAKNFLFLM